MRLDKRQDSLNTHQKGLRAMVAKLVDLDAEFTRLTALQVVAQRELATLSEQRDAIVAAAYAEDNATLYTVADRFHITYARVQQIVQRHEKRAK